MCKLSIGKLFALMFIFFTAVSGLAGAEGRYVISVNIGNGTDATPNTSACPVNVYFRSLHGQSIYTATELVDAGVGEAGQITRIGFFIQTAPAEALPNFIIRMKHTTAFNVAYWQTSDDMVTVFSTDSYAPTAGGYDMLTLDTPFAWNGTDNIVIDTAFSVTGGWSPSGTVQYTEVEDGYRYTRNDFYDQTNVFIGGNSTIYRPNVRLTITQGAAPPSIIVDPPTLYADVHMGESEDMTLNIGNAGGEDLTYDIVESPAVDWFSADPTSGSVGGQGSQAVTGTFSTVGMEPGVYQTTLLVNSNDPQTPQLAVDVQMEVYNTPPTIDLPDSIAIGSGYVTTVDLSAFAHDADDDPLSLSGSGNINISVRISGLMLYLTPREGFIGSELITFTLSDGFDATFDASIVYVDPNLLAIPSASIAQIDPERVRIEWEEVPNALSYEVWGSHSPNGSYVLLGSTAELHWNYNTSGQPAQFFRVIATDAPTY